MQITSSLLYFPAAPACEGDSTYAMPCVWEAISKLDEVCAGTFEAHRPTSSADASSGGAVLPGSATQASGRGPNRALAEEEEEEEGTEATATATAATGGSDEAKDEDGKTTTMTMTTTKMAPLHLMNCDEHALCLSCAGGDNAYCNAVLRWVN